MKCTGCKEYHEEGNPDEAEYYQFVYAKPDPPPSDWDPDDHHYCRGCYLRMLADGTWPKPLPRLEPVPEPVPEISLWRRILNRMGWSR